MMSSWPFLSSLPLVLNVPTSLFHWRQNVCVCMRACVFVGLFLYPYVPSGSVHGFAWNFITPSTPTNTLKRSRTHTRTAAARSYTLKSRSHWRVCCVSFFPISDHTYWWDVCLWWGCLNDRLLLRQEQKTQTLKRLTTDRGLQQTSVVSCVRTGWITGLLPG